MTFRILFDHQQQVESFKVRFSETNTFGLRLYGLHNGWIELRLQFINTNPNDRASKSIARVAEII